MNKLTGILVAFTLVLGISGGGWAAQTPYHGDGHLKEPHHFGTLCPQRLLRLSRRHHRLQDYCEPPTEEQPPKRRTELSTPGQVLLHGHHRAQEQHPAQIAHAHGKHQQHE